MTTPYEQLPPAHFAFSDQGLAQLRDRAATTDRAIATVLYPTPGDLCLRDGCDAPADYLVAALYGTPYRTDVPVCALHFDGGRVLPTLLTIAVEASGLAVSSAVTWYGQAPA